MNHKGEDSRLTSIVRRLRELPSEARPPFDWVQFRERTAARRDASALRLDWRHVAGAASVALAIGALAVWSRVVPDVDPAPHTLAGAYPEAAMERHHRSAAAWLAALPREPAMVRVDTELAITDLEDSIAWIDELLTLERAGTAQADRVITLQRERSRLVDSLVEVRYAETLAAELR